MGSVEEENEAICEKLLKWARFTSEGVTIGWARCPQDRFDMATVVGTPTFLSGDDMLLILEALFAQKGLAAIKIRIHLARLLTDIKLPGGKCQFTPAAVRAVALAYIGSLK